MTTVTVHLYQIRKKQHRTLNTTLSSLIKQEFQIQLTNDAQPPTSGLQAHTFKKKFEAKLLKNYENTVHNQLSIIDDNYGEELTTLDSFSTPVLSAATNISVDFESSENLKNEVQQSNKTVKRKTKILSKQNKFKKCKTNQETPTNNLNT